MRVGRVVLHSSQPWPYPANLMIGCIGEALEDGEEIHLGHDPELQDATWFDLADIREALRRPTEAGEYKEVRRGTFTAFRSSADRLGGGGGGGGDRVH